MKSPKMLAVLCFFVGISGYSTQEAVAQARVGVSAGLNYGALSDVGPLNFHSSTGFHVGVFADVAAGPIGVRPGLLFMSAGPLFRGDATIDRDDANVSLITVPIDLRYRIPLLVVTPYFLVGPELRFATADFALSDEYLRSYNVAANLGAGLELGVPGMGMRFYPEVRYAFDITGLAERVGAANGGGSQRYSPFMFRLSAAF